MEVPYKWNELSETAKHREIIYFSWTGFHQTQPYYDKGHFQQGPDEDNAVMRWYLWHSFRSRDNRYTIVQFSTI